MEEDAKVKDEARNFFNYYLLDLRFGMEIFITWILLANKGRSSNAFKALLNDLLYVF